MWVFGPLLVFIGMTGLTSCGADVIPWVDVAVVPKGPRIDLRHWVEGIPPDRDVASRGKFEGRENRIVLGVRSRFLW